MAMPRFARTLPLAALLLAPLAAGCKPDLGSPTSLVTGPRILAVRGTPAESKQGGSVTYDLLAVDVTGTNPTPDIGWAICTEADPPAEQNDVSDACLTIPDDGSPAPTYTANIPNNACMVFGPQSPTPKKGQPAARPADPDTTGGYYQPVKADWESAGQLAFALERITCPLISAPSADAAQFAASYTPNNNPTLANLVLDPYGSVTILYTAGQASPGPAAVSAGQTLTIQADFTADSAETFLFWDVVSLTLIDQRESLRVSWFATGGSFEHDAGGRAADDTATFTDNTWTAPTTPGTVYLWAVLNDSRGGVDFASAQINVTP